MRITREVEKEHFNSHQQEELGKFVSYVLDRLGVYILAHENNYSNFITLVATDWKKEGQCDGYELVGKDC